MAWFISGSSAIKQYRRYRKVGEELHHKIINAFVDSDILEIAARTLGLGRNRQLVLDSEDELSVLMDFSLYEIRRQGKNLVERYQEEKGGSNRIEGELLDAMLRARTGLFKVKGIMRDKYSLELSDLVNEGRTITLMDINFSQTMANGFVVFFRPIEMADFTMTSGIAFVFRGEMEQELKRRWQRLEEKGSAERYARFFKLSKSRGLTTMYV